MDDALTKSPHPLDLVNGCSCKWAFLRSAFGEEMPWTTADSEEECWQWQNNTDGGRHCYHCDSCDAATTRGGEVVVG